MITCPVHVHITYAHGGGLASAMPKYLSSSHDLR